MKRNLIAIFALGASALFAQYRDGYGQPGYGNQNGGQYPPQSQYDDDNYNYQGYEAPAPPPAPRYAYGYGRPPMPGPGFIWVDGCWSFMRGRYVWVSGYWTRPPFVGGYWMAPRYEGRRFFGGFWAGGRNSYSDRGRGYSNRGYSNHGGGHGYRR